jgi:haloalkane dehalogenase
VTSTGRAAGLAYRAAGDSSDRVALLVHGYPESSYMWRHVLPPLAEAGWRALAPDLPGYGDSEPDRPGTWERHTEALDRFVRELGLGPVALVMHDWGVMIGLRWACDNPDSVRALAISDGGFFADRRWHDVANVMRTPEQGESLVRSYTREGFGAALGGLSSGMTEEALDEYWKAFADDDRRLGQLDLYRSGDFEKLTPYEGRVAGLGVPALIVWGERDSFASVKMADRFHEQLAGSERVIFEQAGHFVWEDAPEPASRALVDFLERRLA